MGYNMFLPTRTLFGAGALKKLHKQSMPGKKALLLISKGKSVRENGALEGCEQQLKLANIDYVVLGTVGSNPLKSVVMEAASFARENQCDFIVALGGGSVMDASKAVATMATNDGDLWDYVVGGTGKGLTPKNQPLPIIAITTTAGTGSEVDSYGVITHDERSEKIGFGGFDNLYPKLAVVDPELMVSVPAKFTAYQGFDALFHSTEVYICKVANLFSDMVALTAIENVAKFLPRAIRDGKDIEARERVAFGNTMSGYSMVAGCCTSEHSLEHAMSAHHHDLPHGAGLIMISKAYYTQLIKKGACPDRFIKMAQVMGMENATEPFDFIKALTTLQESCGVADLKMSDYGISPEEFEELANNAKHTMGGLFFADPVEISRDDCINIFKDSYK
ncbi:MAG: iron-containing alcohol dehydrogenase [Aminipila sp.]